MNMKLTKPILIIILLPLYFLSCNSRPSQVLMLADSLTNTCPDSAIVLLKDYKDSVLQKPKEVQMYYQLLTIKAKDKAYIKHTSDSLIKDVLHYYEKKNDRNHLPEAYYYAGRVYRDLGDAPQALEYFFKAIKSSENSKDYRIISRIYSQTGTLYLYQYTYDEALKVFKKAYQYNSLANDSIGIIYSLRDIGRTFTTLNCADSSLYYYKEALQKAKQLHNKSLMGIVETELAGLYIHLNMYPEAYNAIQHSNKYIKYLDIAPHYSTLAYYYYNINRLDSAAFYYTQALKFDDFYQKQCGYEGLANIARKKGQYKKAMEYFDKYRIYTDSIKKFTKTSTLQKMQSLYNYQLKEKQNHELQQENRKQKLCLIILLSIIALSITLYIIYQQHTKCKKQKIQEQQRLLNEYKEKKYQESLQYIEYNKKQLCQLEEALKQAEGEKNELKLNLIQVQKELLEHTNKQIEAKQKALQMSETALKSSDIYKKFHLATEDSKIGTEDWDALTEIIDNTYSRFTARLYTLHPFNEKEIRTCLLIKIGLKPSQIAPLIPCAKQTLTSIRKKMYEKAHNQPGSPELWDDFIRNF